MLTTSGELRTRLAAAQARERAARADAARIRRDIIASDRRLETQRLCMLGRAWLALGERSPGFRESGAKFLNGYITRPADAEALRGTPWELSSAAATGEPGEASHAGE